MLVAVDYCTRFVTLVPVRRVTSRAVRNALVRLQQQYGAVESVVSDNASCFCARALRRYFTVNRIRHIRVALGHPQANGLAERMIRTVTEGLTALWRERPSPHCCRRSRSQ